MDISTLQSKLDFIKSLYFHEEWKDEDCKNDILEALEEANEKIEKAFGWSMYRLGWKHKPSFEAVEKVVKKFPSTLSYSVGGRIPIQWAAISIRDGIEYVPVLAKEGSKHKVGGKDARGGLLLVHPHENRGLNTLQLLASVGAEEQDAKRVDVLEELRKSGLFKKEDVQEHTLLVYTCGKTSKMRFEYLVNWDPDALIETRGRVPIHFMSTASPAASEETLLIALKAGFRYHPQIGGLLFVKDNEGNIAFDVLCYEKGTEKVMSLLHQILSPNCSYPILHHVLVKAPQHGVLFMDKFPWAYQLKDHNGRSLHQSVLAAGPDVMNTNKQLFASLLDEQIQEKDPVTTLFPFAAMSVVVSGSCGGARFCVRSVTVTSEEFKEFCVEFWKDSNADAYEEVKSFDWDTWMYGTGMPPLPEFNKSLADTPSFWHQHGLTIIRVKERSKMESVAKEFRYSVIAFSRYYELVFRTQKVCFLDALLKLIQDNPLQLSTLDCMEKTYNFHQSKNAEILFRYCMVAVQCRDEGIYHVVIRFITSQGRIKYIRPLYRAMFASNTGQDIAIDTFLKYKDFYHPIASKMIAYDMTRGKGIASKVKEVVSKHSSLAIGVAAAAAIGALAVFKPKK